MSIALGTDGQGQSLIAAPNPTRAGKMASPSGSGLSVLFSSLVSPSSPFPAVVESPFIVETTEHSSIYPEVRECCSTMADSELSLDVPVPTPAPESPMPPPDPQPSSTTSVSDKPGARRSWPEDEQVSVEEEFGFWGWYTAEAYTSPVFCPPSSTWKTSGTFADCCHMPCFRYTTSCVGNVGYNDDDSSETCEGACVTRTVFPSEGAETPIFHLGCELPGYNEIHLESMLQRLSGETPTENAGDTISTTSYGSTPSSEASEPAGSDGSGGSPVWIAGAVIGPLVVVAAVVFGLWFYKRRAAKRAAAMSSEQRPPPAPTYGAQGSWQWVPSPGHEDGSAEKATGRREMYSGDMQQPYEQGGWNGQQHGDDRLPPAVELSEDAQRRE